MRQVSDKNLMRVWVIWEGIHTNSATWKLRKKNNINFKNYDEAYNVMRHLSSEQIHMKWTIIDKKYALRSKTKKKVPEKP